MDDDERRAVLTVLHGQTRQVDDVSRRVETLAGDKEMQQLVCDSEALLGHAVEPPPRSDANAIALPPSVPWAALVQRHDNELRHAGIQPAELTVDELLPAALKARIDADWGIWPEREKWRYWEDFVAVGAAGLAGGLLDLFLSKKLRIGSVGPNTHDEILKSGTRDFKQRFGTDVPNPLRRHVIDAKVPTDLIGGAGQDYHRVAGPGHDLCRTREALDLMMGKQSDFSIGGQSVADKTGGALRMIGLKGDAATVFNTFSDPEQAKFALKLHLWADFFSKRGLPIPGTSHLVDAGGAAAKFALGLYKAGFDARKLAMGLGKLSGVVTTELMLRLHILLQRWRSGQKPYWDWSSKLRYREMFLVAHGIAAGVGGVAAAATWNPGMLNFGAIVASTKNAIQLAYAVHKQRREAIDTFMKFVDRTSADLDELLVRAAAKEVAHLLPA